MPFSSRKGRKSLQISIAVDVDHECSEIATALTWSKSMLIEMAIMHYIDYLTTGRKRASTAGQISKRLAKRGTDINQRRQKTKQVVRYAKPLPGRKKQDTNNLPSHIIGYQLDNADGPTVIPDSDMPGDPTEPT